MNAPNRNSGSGISVTRTLRTPRSSFSESSGDEESTYSLASSTNSLSEFSVTGSVRMFSSPLTTFKNKVVKPKKGSLMRKGDMLGQRRSSERELELDNAEYLSGLMSLHAGRQSMADIDKSFASDFDESGRWLQQI